MFRRTLASLALLYSLGAATALAQSRGAPAPAEGALVAAPAPAAAPANPATIRILTLAWVEVRLPARLLASSVTTPGWTPPPPTWMTLAWQPASPPGGEVTSTAIATRQCTVIRLIAVPCE